MKSELEEQLETAIDDANFNLLELAGFVALPKLALKTGAAIGYSLAMTELLKKLEEEDQET